MSSEELHNLLQTGIQAAQSGNRAIARGIFNQILEIDPNHEIAWVWKATVVDTVAERRECLEKALAINPENERARAALEKLQTLSASAPTTAAEPALISSDEDDDLLQSRPEDEIDYLSDDYEEPSSESPPLFPRVSRQVVFGALTFLALGMIMAGLILLSLEIRAAGEPTATPTFTIDVASLPPTPTPQIIGYVTPTAPGGVPGTPRPEITAITWTPSPTWTPSHTPEPTATLLPLDTYTLLVSAKPEGEPHWVLDHLAGDGSGLRTLPLQLPEEMVEAGLTLSETSQANWSPDGEQFVFTGQLTAITETSTATYQDLFLAPARGGTVTRLTAFEADFVGEAAWSPDGEQIAFTSDMDGDYEIYLAALDGTALAGDPQPLTDNTALDRHPAWSPNGDRIAFTSDRAVPGALAIWIMTSNGEPLDQLTPNDRNCHSPAWSPDGTTLLYLTDQNISTDIYRMGPDGSQPRPLLPDDIESEERDPRWSPDGKWIVFSSNRGGIAFELYLMRPDGSSLHRITEVNGTLRQPVWQP